MMIQKQMERYIKFLAWGMHLLILGMTIIIGNAIIVSFLDYYTQVIVCEEPGVIEGYEKGIRIDKVEAYQDEEGRYKVLSDKKLLAVTMSVENKENEGIIIDGLWPPVFFDEEGYLSTKEVALLEKQYDTYDMRQEGTQIYIPVGNKRQFTVLLEVSKNVEKLYVSYYEYDPYTRRYETEITF